MRARTLLPGLLLVAACGEPGRAPTFQPVTDAPAAATAVVATTTTSTPTANVVDPTVRNPFEQP